MIKEFREFLLKGNLIELAVAFVMGVAFAAVIKSLVDNMITPIIGMIGGVDFSSETFTINDSVFRYGAFINDVIYFVLVAAADLLPRRQAGQRHHGARPQARGARPRRPDRDRPADRDPRPAREPPA